MLELEKTFVELVRVTFEPGVRNPAEGHGVRLGRPMSETIILINR